MPDPYIERLKRLEYLARCSKDADQGSYCSCLWHEAVTDPILEHMGLPRPRYGHLPRFEDLDAARNFFNFTHGMNAIIFGDYSIMTKISKIQLVIEHLEREEELETGKLP